MALMQKDREQSRPVAQSVEEATGHTLGSAVVLCATGIVPVCPFVAAAGG
jgi:hypothetical protein